MLRVVGKIQLPNLWGRCGADEIIIGENKETGWKSSEIREVPDKKGFVLKNKEDTGNTSCPYLIVDDVRAHVALYFFDLNVCVGVWRKWAIAATIAVEDDAQLA